MRVLLLLVFVPGWGFPAAVESGKSNPYDPGKATTIKDPKIPIDQLKLMLKPLTKAELIIEANAWLELLKAKVHQISDARIAVKRQNLQIEEIEQAAEAKQEAKEAEDKARKAEEEARAKGDAKAAKEAEQAALEAKKAAKVAEKEAKEARETEEKALDEKTKAATEDALKKAEEKAKKEAEEKALEGTPVEKAPAEKKPSVPEATTPAVEPEKSQDAKKLKEAAKGKLDVKTTLLENITALEAERTALIDRLEAVLAELGSKGSKEDVDEYKKYISAVSGIVVELSDWDALKATLIGWVKSDEGGIRWAWNLSKFLLTILGAYVLSLILGKVTARATRSSRRMSDLLKDFLTKIVRRTVFLVGLIYSLSALEINIGPVVAVIGAAGFVIAFALQGTLSNFASGLLILMYRPFDVGDIIEAGGVAGKVDSMNLTSTNIKTFDNKSMVVPNNQIWGGVITNATGTSRRRVDMVFGIGYGDDIAKAQAVLEEIVDKNPLVLKDPEPVIKVHELGDSSVNFIVRPWVRTGDYWTVYWEVTRAVKEQFDANGVSIPFPQRDVHLFQETPRQPGS